MRGNWKPNVEISGNELTSRTRFKFASFCLRLRCAIGWVSILVSDYSSPHSLALSTLVATFTPVWPLAFDTLFGTLTSYLSQVAVGQKQLFSFLTFRFLEGTQIVVSFTITSTSWTNASLNIGYWLADLINRNGSKHRKICCYQWDKNCLIIINFWEKYINLIDYAHSRDRSPLNWKKSLHLHSFLKKVCLSFRLYTETKRKLNIFCLVSWHQIFTVQINDPKRQSKRWSEMWLTLFRNTTPAVNKKIDQKCRIETSTCHSVSYPSFWSVSHISSGNAILKPKAGTTCKFYNSKMNNYLPHCLVKNIIHQTWPFWKLCPFLQISSSKSCTF